MKNRTTPTKLMTILLFVLIATGIGCKKESTSVMADNTIRPNDFLAATSYDQLIVEIQSVSGSEPGTATLNNLKTFLTQRLNKPAGITFVLNTIAASGKTTYTLDDIKSLEAAHRTQNANGRTLTAYFFFADGDYALNNGNAKVLGMAYGPSSMVIFEKTIRDFSGGLGQPSATTLESTVIEHEFGHILGLVNNGTVLQSRHQDEANGKHCTDTKCLMHYSVETSDFVANLLGGNIPALDTHCIDDLRGNGGK